jgi:hypothetical protein
VDVLTRVLTSPLVCKFNQSQGERVMGTFQRTFRASAAALLLAGATLGVQAAPVSITRPFMNFESFNFNSLGITRGTSLRIGADGVTPNGQAGTTGVATTTNTITGQAVSRNIDFRPSPATPNLALVALALFAARRSGQRVRKS